MFLSVLIDELKMQESNNPPPLSNAGVQIMGKGTEIRRGKVKVLCEGVSDSLAGASLE